MEELKKLVEILEQKGKSSASALINFSDSTSLETRLYHLIKNDDQPKELQIANELYGEPEISGAFKMLKSRTKKKLYNQLFFLDITNSKLSNELSKTEAKCNKRIYLADLLRRLGEFKIAEQQIKKALIESEESHLVDIQIYALEQLQQIITQYRFNRNEFDDCASKLEYLYNLQSFEREASKRFFDIKFDMKLGVETYYKFKHKLSKYVDELQTLWETTNSNLIFLRYYQLKTMYFELNNENDAFITYLKEIISHNKSGKIHRLYFLPDYNSFLLVFAYLKAKRYEEGLREAEALKNNLETGSRNWFAHLENYFMLAVHSKDYQKAERILTEVLKNKNLNDTTTFSQERWFLFYKALNYISGYTCPSYKFRELKHVTQDKKGYNVWNLILEFLEVLEKKQPDLIERELDRIRKFSSKYLTAKEDARTKTFLKLLQVAGRHFTDSKVARRKGMYLFNKLQQTPAPGIAYAETEIIPYEHLWELILIKMENNK